MLFHLIFAVTLAAAADTTEVQINICDSARTAMEKLGINDWKKDPAEITNFVENKEIQFYKNGWVFKITESTEDGSLTAVLKNNNSKPESDSKVLKCEYDLHGVSKKYACKLSNPISRDHYERVKESHDYYSLLSAEQMDWLRQYDVELPEHPELTTKFEDQDYTIKIDGSKYVLGITVGSRGDEFVELSARGLVDDERSLQSKLLQFLREHHVNICENQNSIHTRMKLETFFKSKITGENK